MVDEANNVRPGCGVVLFIIAIAAALALWLCGCALPAPRSLPPRARRDFDYYFIGWHRTTTAAEDAEALRLWSNYVASAKAWDDAENGIGGFDAKRSRDTCDAMVVDEMKVWAFMARTLP